MNDVAIAVLRADREHLRYRLADRTDELERTQEIARELYEALVQVAIPDQGENMLPQVRDALRRYEQEVGDG